MSPVDFYILTMYISIVSVTDTCVDPSTLPEPF